MSEDDPGVSLIEKVALAILAAWIILINLYSLRIFL